MADTSRIEELRRRVQRDPASIAFAQLAEEYRRAGRYKEAIATCEDGLQHHPGYLSARVTLGRALIETGQLEAAQLELRQVLRAAPENLAALRGLAEIHHRRGELHEALAHYRTALEFARHDPELEHIVEQIQQELEPRSGAPVVVDGLSFDEVKDAFLNLSLPGEEPGASGTEATAEADERAAAGEEPGGEELPGAPGDAREEARAVAPETSVLDTAAVPEPSPPETSVLDTAAIPEPSPIEEPPLLAPSTAPVSLEEEPAYAPPLMLDPTGDDVVPEPAAVAAPGPQVEALDRWLDVILAERQRRG